MTAAEDLVKKYLQSSAQTMQLATVHNGKPWIATVYFVADHDLNVYWLSWPSRRHSKHINEQANVAATVVIKTDQPVIGVQMEGAATIVEDDTTVQNIMKLYVAKYNTGRGYYKAFVAGTNKHQMYKLAPTAMSLFDEVNFPADSPVTLVDLIK